MIQLKSDIEVKQFDDEAVLLDLETGDYFALNAAGLIIANALLAGQIESDIINRLRTEFDISEAQAETDFEAFCEQLKREGLGV